jgi:streptomycin 6-kinase
VADPGLTYDRSTLDEVMETLRALAASQGEPVLLHQDLHTDNVLAADREPWLVIDPKPLLGEREFNVAPIVRDYVLGHSRSEVLRRLERLTSELGLDRERALGWTIGQTVAWMFESTHLRTHLDTLRWLLEARR